MKNLNNILLGVLFLIINSQSISAPFAYAIDGDTTPSPLYEIDLATNSITNIGTTTGLEFESIAFGPGGILYGIDNGADQLFTISTVDATPTLIGSTVSSVRDPGMSYCPDNSTMYVASEDGEFYSQDLNTGALTLIGTDNSYAPTGLACTTTGILYAIDDSSDNLYSVDRTTGNSTLIGSLGVDIADGGLTMSGSQLLMSADESPTNLYSLDTNTGAANFVFEIDSSNLGIEGLAADFISAPPAIIPTLSISSILLLMLLSLLIAQKTILQRTR